MQTILEVKNLTKYFGYLLAVDHLDFQIEKGKVYGLLGPNGSGKSTTMGMILNVVNKTEGEIQWFDGQITGTEALKKIGAIIERPNFYPYLTAKQNLELVCKIKEIGNDNIENVLKMLNLFSRKDDKFKTYSLGMKQRLAIASALLNNPELLILDEPTNGLDPQGIHEIRELIKTISREGVTVILASHLLDEVEKVCDKVIVLQKGKKIWEGDVNDMSVFGSWFEVVYENPEKVKKILINISQVKKTEINQNTIKIFTENISGSELNKILAENNVFVETLIKKKLALEDKFLAITKNRIDEKFN